jgi:hypothetical protein
MGSPAIQRDLLAEDHSQDEPDAKRCEDGFGRVFANVLLAIILKCADAALRILPRLFGATAILTRDLRGRSAKVFGCLTRMCARALETLRRRRTRRSHAAAARSACASSAHSTVTAANRAAAASTHVALILFSHDLSPVNVSKASAPHYAGQVTVDALS